MYIYIYIYIQQIRYFLQYLYSTPNLIIIISNKLTIISNKQSAMQREQLIVVNHFLYDDVNNIMIAVKFHNL